MDQNTENKDPMQEGGQTPIPQPTPIPEPTEIPAPTAIPTAEAPTQTAPETPAQQTPPQNGYSASWNNPQPQGQTYIPPQQPNTTYIPPQQQPGYVPPQQTAWQNPAQGQNPTASQIGAGQTVVFGNPQQGGYYVPGGAAPGYYVPPKKKKPKKYASRSLGVWALILAIVLSVGCGIGGAFLGAAMARKGTVAPVSPNGTVEIRHYTVEGVEEADTDGTVTAVYNKVSDAVVEIRTETVTTSSIYGQYVTSGAGSGVIISKDGYIITCAHVIEGATKVTVTMKNGEVYEAKTVGSDSETDIGVVKIEAKQDFPFASFGDSEKLVVGDHVVAIGNPLGSLGGTTTDGIVSALNREIEIEKVKYSLLQTNAAINPGNSGGGLFDMNGLLIGIVNAKSTGEDVEGLGFAVPAATAEKIATELIANGYVKGRPMLGVKTFEIQSQEDYYNWWQYNRYITENGVYVAESDTDLFKVGDRIVAIDGVETPDYAKLKQEINRHKVGDTIPVTVSRDGQLVTFDLTLKEKTE